MKRQGTAQQRAYRACRKQSGRASGRDKARTADGVAHHERLFMVRAERRCGAATNWRQNFCLCSVSESTASCVAFFCRWRTCLLCAFSLCRDMGHLAQCRG